MIVKNLVLRGAPYCTRTLGDSPDGSGMRAGNNVVQYRHQNPHDDPEINANNLNGNKRTPYCAVFGKQHSRSDLYEPFVKEIVTAKKIESMNESLSNWRSLALMP